MEEKIYTLGEMTQLLIQTPEKMKKIIEELNYPEDTKFFTHNQLRIIAEKINGKSFDTSSNNVSIIEEKNKNVIILNSDTVQLFAENLKNKVSSYKNICLEIVQELYEAQKFYNNSGFRSDLVSNETRLNTFQDFLNYIGMSKPTAYRWLEKFVPEENRLLSYEEIEVKKQEKEAINKEKKINNKLFENIIKERNSEYETIFNNNKDYKFDDELKQESWEEFKNFKSTENKIKEENEVRNKQYYDNQWKTNTINQKIDNFNNDVFVKFYEKIELKNKLKITSGDDVNLIDIVDDYLDVVENDNTKLNILHNLLKYCKEKTNELQRKASNN